MEQINKLEKWHWCFDQQCCNYSFWGGIDDSDQIWKKTWEDNINYFSNVGFDSGIIGIKYLNDNIGESKLLNNVKGPVAGFIFNSNGYVKKPIHVMQIENLGKLTNIEKCNNF